MGKIKSVLMGIRKVSMIIFCSDFFISEVKQHSPCLSRLFHEIRLSPIKSLNEVESCIKEPLKEHGYDSNNIIDKETITDIHTITDGAPFHIKKICHHMLKMVHRKKDDKMRLNINFINEIIENYNEYKIHKDTDFTKYIMNLTNERLLILGALCYLKNINSLDQISCIESLFDTAIREDIIKISKNLFLSDSILRMVNDRLVPNANKFELVYLKYSLMEVGLDVAGQDDSLDEYIISRFSRYLTENYNVSILSYDFDSTSIDNSGNMTSNVKKNKSVCVITFNDPSLSRQGEVADSQIYSLKVGIKTFWNDMKITFQLKRTASDNCLKDINSICTNVGLLKKASDAGIKLNLSISSPNIHLTKYPLFTESRDHTISLSVNEINNNSIEN
jgi:hypothetical protein